MLPFGRRETKCWSRKSWIESSVEKRFPEHFNLFDLARKTT